MEHAGKRLIVRRNEAAQGREQRCREDQLRHLQDQVNARNAFVAMLVLKINGQLEQNLRQAFGAIGQADDAITPEDALLALGRLTYLYTTDHNGERHAHPPRPDPRQSKILDALGLSIPRKQTAAKRAM